MKKTYTKPYIAVESFQLDAAIASSCTGSGKQALGYTINNCNLDDDKGTTAFQGLHYFGDICQHDVRKEYDANDLICYHGPGISAVSTFMNS